MNQAIPNDNPFQDQPPEAKPFDFEWSDQHVAETETASAVEQEPGPAEEQPPETVQPTKFKLTWQFAAGFLGWFLVNGLAWLILLSGRKFSSGDETAVICNGALILPLNLIILVLLAWKVGTRQIAWGILAAWGVNLVVSLVLGLSTNAFCLVPFFY